MTDTPASLDALGIKPVGWSRHHKNHKMQLSTKRLYRGADKYGYTETALYSADDLAPLIAKARRVEELEAVLREVERRTALLIRQNTGRWKVSVEHDLRTCEVLSGNQDIIRAALKENTDATSEGNNGDR